MVSRQAAGTVCKNRRLSTKLKEPTAMLVWLFRQVSEMGMRQLGRAAAAASAQAAGGLQRPRWSRAVEDEQARRTPRKGRLPRGAIAGLGSSVMVGRGVVSRAPSARQVGGIERAQELGPSRARARRWRSKSHRRTREEHVCSATRTEQPPIH